MMKDTSPTSKSNSDKKPKKQPSKLSIKPFNPKLKLLQDLKFKKASLLDTSLNSILSNKKLKNKEKELINSTLNIILKNQSIIHLRNQSLLKINIQIIKFQYNQEKWNLSIWWRNKSKDQDFRRRRNQKINYKLVDRLLHSFLHRVLYKRRNLT